MDVYFQVILNNNFNTLTYCTTDCFFGLLKIKNFLTEIASKQYLTSSTIPIIKWMYIFKYH